MGFSGEAEAKTNKSFLVLYFKKEQIHSHPYLRY